MYLNTSATEQLPCRSKVKSVISSVSETRSVNVLAYITLISAIQSDGMKI